MNTDNLIIGAGGGGKGGGSARAAVEAKNTLRSRQFARIVDLICEGEVEGLVGSNISAEATEKSIYFDGVPLRNEAGQPNFDINAFSWAFVPGTQNQPVIPTGGTVASEVQVSQEVKYGNTGGGPVVRSISEQYIDSCRVTVLVPRLTVQNTENGDINGGNIVFAIDVQNNGGGFVEVMRPTIEGKTNSEYQRSYEFELPEPGPWDIRVRRITLDAETSNIQNQLYWSTFTKIVKQPLSYPNTALMGLKVDSALFNRVPSRAYKMRLLKVRVPSNYNPETRAYAGMWNGTFKTAWTDNPAWCWYDLATNTRYGLGEYLDSDNIDKWTLYQIAQYCDELVSDGRGGQEPRFTCNLYINTREEALKVLMNMASIFRGIVYWHSNTIFCSQDRPSSPVKLFTQANVIDGVFTYSGSAKQARHTVAYVSWNDPENLYKQTVEYVEDRESILRLGVRETEVTAMGCTSRSQANRLGRWILLTEREETDTVTFRTGLEGCGVMPGEIIQTTDPSRSGTRLGGRIVSATSTSIQLDGEVTLEPGRNYTIAVLLPSGTIEEKLVNWAGSQDLVTSTLQLNSQLAEIPQKNAIWILQADNLVAELWRVVSAVEASPGVIELTAVEHIPGKYAAIEQNLKLEPRPTSQINIRPSAVTNLVATTDVKKLNSLQYTTRIFVSWTPPKEGAARYIVTWRRGTDNDKTSITNDPAFDIDDVPAGTFEISVVAENAIGLRGPATTITHVVSESDVEADVQNLRLDPNFLGKDCPITWDRLDWAVKYTVQVYNNSTLLREVPVLENKYVYTYTQNTADGGPYRNLEFKVKAHSWRGTSANWATLAANNPAPATPVGVSLEAGPGQVSITADKPEDQDLAGMIVLMGETPQTVNQLIYRGRDNAFMKTNLQAGILVYFKVAFYDDFGDTGLNYSSIVSTRPLAFGGIKSVTVLPDSPADVAGDTAVFLDVPETTGQRGLWGWDGTTWKYTRDGDYLVANSVTAEKINALNLSSISANLGTITGGNLTLAADGFIKGGATNYSSGTGFWMGYDSGTYKLRAGSPQSSGFEWDGSAFNVRGPDGSITISSGVVDWAKISGAGKPANNATRNVFQGDWTTSTSYAVGDIVLKDGNGWSCILAHTSTSSNQPPASGSGNTWWTLYAVKGSDGAQGLHALTVLVPNSAHTLPAASDGVVASYTGSGTTIQVFEGTTALSAVSSITANGQFTIGTPTQVPASTITVGARSYAGTTATVAQHSAMVAGTDLVVVTYPITVRRLDGTTVTLSATQTLTKSKAGAQGVDGAPGPAGPAVVVTADRALSFTATDGALDDSQANIVLTAAVSGIASPTYAWTFSGLQTNPTASTTSSQTITAAQFGTSKSATVTCTVNGSYVDQVTIVRLEKSTAEAGATVGATIGTNLSGQINSSNVTTYIANAAIGSAQIADASITNAKIANATILAANIADGNITNAKIANAAITGAKIASATIGSANIADASITNSKIANLAVDTANIVDLTVTTAKIGNLAVTNIASAYTAAATSTGSSGTWTNIQSVAITTAGGNVIIQASGCVRIVAFAVRVRRGSTVIATLPGTFKTGAGFFSFQIVDTPTAGAYTYYIDIDPSGGGGDVQGRALVLLERKK